MDTSMESKQSNMILSKKPEVESSFLKIPLEMLREIYHICSPDPTLLIWACPPLLLHGYNCVTRLAS